MFGRATVTLGIGRHSSLIWPVHICGMHAADGCLLVNVFAGRSFVGHRGQVSGA